MINSKDELRYFLLQDAIAMGVQTRSRTNRIKAYFLNPRWRFILLMRKVDYYTSGNRPFVIRCYGKILYFKYKQLGLKLGFTIPPSIVGSGFSLPHYGTVVISKQAKIGRNCRIHVDVNIGASGGKPEAPTIGDNVYIGPGAKLFGNIKIADNVYIGANAVVNKSVSEEGAIIGGIPAKILKISAKPWWRQNGVNLS